MTTSRFILIGVLVALVLGGGVALFASSAPDGLESVLLQGCETDDDFEITGGECVLGTAEDHEIGGPLDDYGMSFIRNESLGGALSGVVGVLLTLGVATGLFWLLARKKQRT
jgi:cobalt/nickel transport protein